MTTVDPQRLQRVAMELAAAVSQREAGGPRVRLPVLQRADAAALIGMMHGQLDEAIAQRSAEVAQRGGVIACNKGCNACCASAVVVTEGEAVAVTEWLKLPENAGVRARYEAAYKGWSDKLGELVAEAGVERSREDDLAWCITVKERQAMCAFNHDGACSIYPVRPSLCRKTHALDTNEHCGGSTYSIKYYQHPETENVYTQQQEMRIAMHSSLRPTALLDMLCSAVHRLLGGAAAGRNEPCPCGSGKKYKKCHGA
jgi:Fe-S-cluster containining protein